MYSYAAIMLYSSLVLVSLSLIVGGIEAFSPIQNGRTCSLSRMPSLVFLSSSSSSRQPLVMLRMSDDGGWYDDDENSISDVEVRSQELRSLQKARQSSRQTTQQQQQQKLDLSSSNKNNQEPERDLFIPIFALVSILGFAGLYGYEMLRLASRGELYLPSWW
jgi:hypothetical protein